MWEIDEKILMNQIRMIKFKEWVTNIETETIRRKIENGRDEVNEGTMKENDNTADIMMKILISTMQIVRMKYPLE